MKIYSTKFEEFCFGEASEKYIQSEFYALGYEALKTSPDIGYEQQYKKYLVECDSKDKKCLEEIVIFRKICLCESYN